MDRLGSADILLFEGFRLDRSGGGLFRLDQADIAAPVALGSRALDLLGLLTERQGELVSKDAIMEAVWPGMVVEEGNLTVQISALRRVLDQNREGGSCIQTLPGRGYRFVAPVTRVEPAAPPVPVRPSGNGSGGPIAGNRDPQGPGVPGQPRRIPAETTPRDRHRLSRGVMAAVLAALGLFAVVAAGNWHLPWSGEARSVPRLSIVVLPFTDLSGDPGQGYIADGVTDDLTTDLSRIADMFVISRNTAFTYRNKPVDAKRIGRELGVRYVLDGSVRRSGNQVRVNAQLIDAETDAHLWAERFDRDAGNLFALQDEITSRIAVALNLELIGTEAARPTDDPDTLDYILRGRAAWAKAPTRDNYREVIGLFEHALALDPRSVEGQSLLATALANRILDYMTGSTAADIERAEELTDQALAASPRNPLAHWAKGQLLTAKFRYDEAIPEYETVIAFNRNSADAYSNLGWCKLYTGSIGGDDPAPEASHSPQSARSVDRTLVLADRGGASAPIAHRGGGRLARKGAQRKSGITGRSRLPRLSLCPQRRNRTRCRRIRGSPAAQRQSLSDHRQPEGRPIFRGAEDPSSIRNHFFRRPPQGRNARRVTAARTVPTYRVLS